MNVVYFIKWMSFDGIAWKIHQATVKPNFVGNDISTIIDNGGVVIKCEAVMQRDDVTL